MAQSAPLRNPCAKMIENSVRSQAWGEGRGKLWDMCTMLCKLEESMEVIAVNFPAVWW